MMEHTRVYAQIDLGAALSNFRAFHELAGDHAKICAVVKADAYGHGAVEISRMLQPFDWIWGFAVAEVPEAEALRRAGIVKPILILGYVFPEDDPFLAAEDVRPAVFSRERAEHLAAEAVRQGKQARIHIALDTGMSRIGFPDTDEAVREVAEIARMEGIIIEGLFTHFARADEADKTNARGALRRYLDFCGKLEEAGVHIPIRHVSNSAALLELPEARLDMVRTGIINYGVLPSDEMRPDTACLKPVMSLKTRVTHVKSVPAGVPVSYGGTFVTERETVIATIPAGYADGYPRSLSGKGYVLIDGHRCPILGRVCMDQFMVDVTGIACRPGQEVTLMGEDHGEVLPVETLSALSGRFPYEFLCCIGKRVPRVFLNLDEEQG